MDYMIHTQLIFEERSLVVLKKIIYHHTSQKWTGLGIVAVAYNYGIIDFLREDILDSGRI